MAGIKRKGARDPASQGSNVNQKPRKEERPAKKSRKDIHIEETATDSDPIIESDTASQSGDDDGVSWPSNADEEQEQWEGVKEENDTGGVKVAAEAAANEGSTPKTSLVNGIGASDVHTCRISL